MEHAEEKILRLLETFYKATQIEALYLDRQLSTTACQYSKYAFEDFQRLSMNRIESFILEILEKENDADKRFYTYFLDNNLVCNIVPVWVDGACQGAVVTLPVLLNALKDPETDAMLGFIRDPGEQDKYKEALQRAPVVPYERIMPIGEVLSALSRPALDETGFRQILRGGDVDPAVNQLIQTGILANREHKPVTAERHSAYSTYLRIKECITKGDAGALLAAIGNISAGSVPMDQLDRGNFVRSLKNSFIKVCAMSCYAAVEAGASYTKVMDISDDFISRMEALENINDIYELMKAVLLAFTRAVAVTHITAYSKPIRLSIEYIESHYTEKITLGALAEHVNLSASYLSNLIKKETGMNLSENINKVRIEESKKILLKSSVNVTELASMVGYAYSNHFARMFRRFTGMTPSEYKKSVSRDDKESNEASDILRLLLDQLGHTMSVFPGLIDVGRIVDPAINISWIQLADGEVVQGTCFNFWNKRKSCEKCISHMAYEQNRPFMKLEQKPDATFLVVAAPVMVGSKRYVLELLKSIADNFYDCTGASVQSGA